MKLEDVIVMISMDGGVGRNGLSYKVRYFGKEYLYYRCGSMFMWVVCRC